VTPLEMALAGLVVMVSAWVQASVGFGYALLSAPLLALITPTLVPGPIMLSSMLLSAAAAWRERASVDRAGVTWSLLGRIPGAVLAGAVLVSLTPSTLDVVFAGSVLLGVLMSVAGVRLSITTPSLLSVGFVSGIMATLSSIGGPPMAMLYQHEAGPKLRSTLNSYFALGGVVTLPVLAWAGRFGPRELVAGALLLPACGVGFWLAQHTRAFLDAGRTRSAVLTLATVSALGVALKALW
jgi:uncharacterized protein